MYTEFMYLALAVYLLLGACSEVGLVYGMSFETLLEANILLIVMVFALSKITVSYLTRYTMSRNADPAEIKPKVLASRRHSGVTFYLRTSSDSTQCQLRASSMCI